MKSKHRISTWLLALTFLVGAGILLIAFTETPAIKHLGKKEYAEITADKITKAAEVERQNRQQSDNFNYAKTNQLSPITVVDYEIRSLVGQPTNYHPAGRLMIPAVNLYLPIGIGVSNAILVRGAGTLKPDQKMGEGNYALAGHYMTNTKILFSPLKRVKKGAKIIVTDLRNVYTYRTVSNRVINKNNVGVIDDLPGRKLITLITCASSRWNEPKRIVVQGELQMVQKYTKK